MLPHHVGLSPTVFSICDVWLFDLKHRDPCLVDW